MFQIIHSATLGDSGARDKGDSEPTRTHIAVLFCLCVGPAFRGLVFALNASAQGFDVAAHFFRFQATFFRPQRGFGGDPPFWCNQRGAHQFGQTVARDVAVARL